MSRTAIVVGAGPAGLTAALELLRRTDIKPIILEASDEIGGISRTIRYKGNRMDIGGHRFFSKSDRVMQWWMDLMPPELDGAAPAVQPEIAYQGQRRTLPTGGSARAFATRDAGAATATALAVEIDTDTDETEADGEVIASAHGHTETHLDLDPETIARDPDLVMLIRPRKSRIYYLRKFFDYPIKLTGSTLANLGAVRTAKVGTSYLASRVKQIKPERSLEDFLINRFGRQLYLTFFKSYTEKVWGTPCDRISAEWGAQRIKGLSLTTAVKHFVRKSFAGGGNKNSGDVAQKDTDTSLIERFMYPKFGPGQLWEHAAEEIIRLGGEIHRNTKVDSITCRTKRVTAVTATTANGSRKHFQGDFFFSTMPMRDLVRAMETSVPDNVREVSEGLEYRDFITVGLLCDRLKVKEPDGGLLKDTWIYVQEPDVLLGRLQIFNNWSPYLVSDPDKVWIGLEYFCYETDDLWKKSDDAMKQFAIEEVAKIGILDAANVSDAHVVRVPKTYPAYFGTYDRFDELRGWTDQFENLFLVGRNGMHKYNNQDHSMLTAMTVVDGLIAGHVDKAALWDINTEQDYHEERKK